MLEEPILKRLVAGIVPGNIEQRRILRVILRHRLHLLVIVRTRQRRQAVRIHLAAARIQLGAIVLRQLGAKRVDRNDDRPSVRLEGENLAHHVRRGAAQTLAERIERLQIRLVQRVPDDLDVHLVQILLGDAIDEERRQRRVHQHRIVQLRRIGGHMDRLHLLEAAERMALGDQLADGALMQRAGDQQNDVVDHVAVRDEVEERGQRLDGMVAQMLELDHQLLAQLVVDDADGQRRRLVGQELAVVGALQMQLQICSCRTKREREKRENEEEHRAKVNT